MTRKTAIQSDPISISFTVTPGIAVLMRYKRLGLIHKTISRAIERACRGDNARIVFSRRPDEGLPGVVEAAEFVQAARQEQPRPFRGAMSTSTHDAFVQRLNGLSMWLKVSVVDTIGALENNQKNQKNSSIRSAGG